MKPKLLPYLACPGCGGPVHVRQATAHDDGVSDEILEGELECASCMRHFPVVGGVPRFVDFRTIEHDKAATAANFGWQWQHFTQEDERYREQFLGWIAPVDESFFAGKTVLEAGCGKGRHTKLVAGWGAREVIGVDISSAVDTAFAQTRELPNAHIIQADIYNLPLRPAFDYAFSVGVLHHLPDPRAGFVALAGKVRAGGYLSAWVYGAENNEWITRWVSPLREKWTSRMDGRTLLRLSKLPTAFVYAATKLLYRPLNRSARGRMLARHLFYNDYLSHIGRFGWREQHTIVFDHLVAPTACYVGREEFESWWRDIGADDVVTSWHNRNSWRGLGRIGAGEGDGSPIAECGFGIAD